MKKLFVSALAMLAVALGFTACSSEDEFVKETPAQGKKVTVIASTEEPGQRTMLGTLGEDGKYPVYWSPTDNIKIDGKVFTLTSGDGTSTGVFTGTAPTAGTYEAYYPSAYNGENWPTGQTYVEGNIPHSVPMKATGITVDENRTISPISFKNEGGILRLNLKGTAKVKSITISATDLDAITLDCSKETGGYVPLNSDGVPFHIAVKAAAYSGLKIEITNNEGNVCTKTANKAITVQRSMITDITLTAGSFVTPTINGHAYVVLAGYKWATENVGAVKEGETQLYNAMDVTYGYLYTQANAVSAAESWGGTWELPTEEQWEALMDENNFTWTWTNQDGKAGYKVSDNNDASKFIFLPAAGYYYESVFDQGNIGCYWSAGSGGYLYFGDGFRDLNLDDPSLGMAVRPVSE